MLLSYIFTHVFFFISDVVSHEIYKISVIYYFLDSKACVYYNHLESHLISRSKIMVDWKAGIIQEFNDCANASYFSTQFYFHHMKCQGAT